MTRAVTLANLADQNILTADGVNDRVGIGSTQPTVKLDVAGIVTATAFYGDGSNLEGVASAGLGTALSDVDTEANSVIYFTNTTLGIGSTVVVDPPSSSNVAYTQYQEVSLDADVDLIVAEGDDFVPDILGLEEGAMLFGANASGGGSSSGIAAVVEDTTPQLGGNLDLNSKTINGNGNINITGTFSGDGSGLTNLSGVGAGIGVSNSGTSVGTAQTINFGTGISISAVNAGFATVTVSAASTADVNTSSLVVSGVSTLAGATFSGVTTFTDNITADGITLDLGSETSNLYIGRSNDRIEMSHNTSNGNLTCTTGYMYIRGVGGFRVQKEGGGYDDLIIANSDGSVELFYDDVKRLETSTNGVHVTGIVTASTHVDSGIVTYRGDSSYSAAGRWVLGADGTNHYTFTGPGLGHSTLNDPTLYLMRGQTYMFENKMGAHPFRIQSTSNGSAGTQWNVGVTNNDVSNGVLIFEVPFVCPNTLYYQCTAHANMGGVLNIVT